MRARESRALLVSTENDSKLADQLFTRHILNIIHQRLNYPGLVTRKSWRTLFNITFFVRIHNTHTFVIRRCHYHGNENGKLLSMSNLHLMCVIEWQSEFLRRGAITKWVGVFGRVFEMTQCSVSPAAIRIDDGVDYEDGFEVSAAGFVSPMGPTSKIDESH